MHRRIRCIGDQEDTFTRFSSPEPVQDRLIDLLAPYRPDCFYPVVIHQASVSQGILARAHHCSRSSKMRDKTGNPMRTESVDRG